MAIGGFRQALNLAPREAPALGFAPLAVLLAIARRHLEHEPVTRPGRLDIDDVDDLVPRG